MAHALPGYPHHIEREGAGMSEIDEQRGDGEVGRCHVCGGEFDTQEELSKHLMDAHDEDLLPDPDPDQEAEPSTGSARA
jgi:hypothetical protein